MGTEHEDDTCPRRHALQEPLVPLVHRIWRHTDGKLGVEVFERPTWLLTAFDVVANAIAFSREQESNAD